MSLELPETLKAAVRVFVVARAIRLTAADTVADHNSMLVNVSRFVAVQGQIRNEIHALVAGYSHQRSRQRGEATRPSDA